MTRRPSFQFYPADFLTGTNLMTAAAVGSYIRMLCIAWGSGPIPNTPTALWKALSLSPADPPFEQIWAEVRPKWVLTEPGWINPRLEQVRAAQERYIAQQRTYGLQGGRPSKDPDRQGTERVAFPNPFDSEKGSPKGSLSKTTENQKGTETSSSSSPDPDPSSSSDSKKEHASSRDLDRSSERGDEPTAKERAPEARVHSRTWTKISDIQKPLLLKLALQVLNQFPDYADSDQRDELKIAVAKAHHTAAPSALTDAFDQAIAIRRRTKASNGAL